MAQENKDSSHRGSARGAIKTAKRIKWLIGILGTLPISVPIVIIIVFVMTFILLITSIASHPDSPVGPPGGPIATTSGVLSPLPSGPLNIPPCSEVWDRLRSDFGASTYTGNSHVRFNNCDALQKIYTSYAISSRSTSYLSLLRRAGRFDIRILPYSKRGSCAGDVLINRVIRLYYSTVSGCVRSQPNYLILHETGHHMRQHVGSIMPRSQHNRLVQLDRHCYEQAPRGWFLKSYSLRTTIPDSESSAEAMALYVTGGKDSTYNSSKPIRNFKQECPDVYNYERDNIFGGYEFH